VGSRHAFGWRSRVDYVLIFRESILVMTQNMTLILGLLAVSAIVALASPLMVEATGAASAEPQLAHMVYFKLKDNSGGSRAKLVAACKLFLTNHPGTLSFATGTLAGDFTREVNDRDFDVSLHLVFTNKAAHDKYQDDPRHLKFVEENKENWEKVRVFDSYLSPVPATITTTTTPQ
jgi:Stress responsive A/B Barrel Domain